MLEAIKLILGGLFMKLWVFKQNNGEVIFVSEEKERGKIIIYSLNKMGIIVKREDTWGYIDDLKAQGKLFYVTTIRTLKLTNIFFKVKW